MLKTFFVKTKIKTKTFISRPRPTKTCVFVLEAPRDQDLGLEDYITAFFTGLTLHRPNNSTEVYITKYVSSKYNYMTPTQ